MWAQGIPVPWGWHSLQDTSMYFLLPQFFTIHFYISVSSELLCGRGHIAHVSLRRSWAYCDGEGKDRKATGHWQVFWVVFASLGFFLFVCFWGFFWPCKSETITTLKWVDDQWLSRLGQTYLHILAIWINISGKEKIRQRQFSYSFYKLSPENITNHTENSLYRKLRESAGFRNTFCDGSKSEP